MLLVHHIKATRCTDSHHHWKIKQVILLKLVDRVSVDACTSIVLVIQSVWIDKVAEFVFDQLGFVRKILDVSTDQLA